jgi:hypothetical protein
VAFCCFLASVGTASRISRPAKGRGALPARGRFGDQPGQSIAAISVRGGLQGVSSSCYDCAATGHRLASGKHVFGCRSHSAPLVRKRRCRAHRILRLRHMDQRGRTRAPGRYPR